MVGPGALGAPGWRRSCGGLLTRPPWLQVGDRSGELTARMNVAQLQLALGRLASPAAAEKPDLAGYEAQGELRAGAGGPTAPAPGSDLSSGAGAWEGRDWQVGCQQSVDTGSRWGAWWGLPPDWRTFNGAARLATGSLGRC